jgi:NAD(P)-dependent dehydrogenase (short-subunit alcohol dehydrogenase family)
MGSLDGRVAIVTGAGRGIGRSIATLLASEGAKVVVNDLGVQVDGSSPDSGPADDTVAEIAKAGGTAVANHDSVADYDAAENIIRTALDTYGKLDVLVNVAGILRDRMIFNMTEDEWDAVVDVHMKGTGSSISRRSPGSMALPDSPTTRPPSSGSSVSRIPAPTHWPATA